MVINGKCHCGNVSFVLEWQPEPLEIPARACTCSFCTKHGGVWTSCPTGSLKVSVMDRSLVSKYAFGTRTATFHVCSLCGVVPVVTSEIEGRLYAVASVHAFEGTYGDYVLAKVGKVFPELKAEVLTPGSPPPSPQRETRNETRR